jgi:hypothetical protein
MAFIHTKKVDIESFIKARIRIRSHTSGSGSDQKGPDSTGSGSATLQYGTSTFEVCRRCILTSMQLSPILRSRSLSVDVSSPWEMIIVFTSFHLTSSTDRLFLCLHVPASGVADLENNCPYKYLFSIPNSYIKPVLRIQTILDRIWIRLLNTSGSGSCPN